MDLFKVYLLDHEWFYTSETIALEQLCLWNIQRIEQWLTYKVTKESGRLPEEDGNDFEFEFFNLGPLGIRYWGKIPKVEFVEKDIFDYLIAAKNALGKTQSISAYNVLRENTNSKDRLYLLYKNSFQVIAGTITLINSERIDTVLSVSY